jgi:alpha-D-ribose 1-methylphosphonate 5-triphosphate synthase subunit PhnG
VSPTDTRRCWMSVLALASTAELEAVWRAVPAPPRHRMLRWPETGLAMVRGRAGGTGTRFNLGEMTVTRCAVQLEGGAVGVAYVRGRERRHAELAIVAPLAAAQAARRRATAERVAPSRVEFFTMVRGED